MSTPARRRASLIERYRADSTGRRNTFDHILFGQPVESLRRCLPAQRFAWSCVQRMSNGAQLVGDVEYATLEWVDWFKTRRLLEPIGNTPPAEAEANFYAAPETGTMAA